MKAIVNHVSIRKFSNRVVDDSLIEEIVEIASRVPSTGNKQLYSVVVNKEPEQLNLLKALHYNQLAAKNAPVILTFVADYHRFVAWCKQRDAEPGYNNFLSFITAAMDAILMVQNTCLVAEEKGLGTCYLGTTLYNAAEIIELLKLPKLTLPIVSLSIGYPDEAPEQSDKLPVNAILHKESYQPYTTNDIDVFYQLKENLSSSMQFVKENNKKTLAQVYTDVRYKKADNEAFSRKLLQTLINQEFLSEEDLKVF